MRARQIADPHSCECVYRLVLFYAADSVPYQHAVIVSVREQTQEFRRWSNVTAQWFAFEPCRFSWFFGCYRAYESLAILCGGGEAAKVLGFCRDLHGSSQQ